MKLNIESLRVPETENSKKPSRRINGKFLRGPVSKKWLNNAAQACTGSEFKVGITLWYLAGLNNNHTVRLSTKVLREFALSRQTGWRALESLEREGLVVVDRRLGRQPIVTILNID